MEKSIIRNTETMEQLFENYKASYNEETPQTAGQSNALDNLNSVLECIENQANGQSVSVSNIWQTSVQFARESEKSGFVLGFRMAMNLMSECMG